MTTITEGHAAQDHAHDSHGEAHGPPRPEPLAVHHQPQGHRHPLPGVRPGDAVCRRRHGADYPCRTVSARAAVRESGILQPDDHDARPDHGLRHDHAGLRRLRQLDDPDDDRCTGHGAAAAQQLVVLDPALCRHDPAVHAVHGWRWRRQPAGRSIRRWYCSRATRWPSRSLPCTCSACHRSSVPSTSS